MTIWAPDADGIARAAAALRAGEIVAIPTESVYGLAGDASNPVAVAAIFAAKGRPAFNPLIAHVLDLDAARREAQFCAVAERLAAAFWPGPLTLVLPRAPGGVVCDLACAGLASIAVRAPSHLVARALLNLVGRPLAAPSANRSGRLSPTEARHVIDELGEGIPVLDGGRCSAGVESTIVALTPGEPGRLLRPGAIARAAIEVIAGPLTAASAGPIAAPGMLASHYAPNARLRLNATAPVAGEAYLGFGAYHVAGHETLSARGDLQEAAGRLYALLRALDSTGAETIAVAPIPEEGLGEAINDRLRRAAAPR